jgi:Tfp pilus assembly protein PilX
MGGGKVGISFTNFNVSAVVNSTSPTKATYFGTPLFYVTDLGQSAAAGAGEIYQIDAAAWGGTGDTVAVVESTYLITPSGHNYDK